MMYRKFIAIVLATAVGITGVTAAPARADENDLLKILGGVAAIAIIGAAIAESKDDDKVSRNYNYYNGKRNSSRRSKHHHGHRDRHHHHKHDDYRRDDYRNDGFARPLPNRVQRKVLPASCRVRARDGGNNFLAYSDWCLDRKFQYANALPRRCAINARVLHNNKRNRVYSSRCLSRYGYTSANY